MKPETVSAECRDSLVEGIAYGIPHCQLRESGNEGSKDNAKQRALIASQPELFLESR